MATKRYPLAVQAYISCRDAHNASIARDVQNDLLAERRLEDQIQALEEERVLLNTGRDKTDDLWRRARPRSTALRICARAGITDAKTVPEIPSWISLALGSAYFRTGAMADAEREYRAALGSIRSSAKPTTTLPSSACSRGGSTRRTRRSRRPRSAASK